ncbi:hypothetical protein GALL_397290 [mine drainage metagenome]|uniref:Uncharacterized protein n=1 Tax=mine drainage metagenome TaxID=410659 RepID=A0A1J5Q5C4_9ZZZZ
MCWGHFDHAGAEFTVHVVVGNDGNFTHCQRQAHHLADQVSVALILRMHHDGGIAQHGFRAGGGHDQTAGTVRQRVADLPHEAVFLLAHHFQVGYRGMQLGIPVYQPFAAIDQAFVVQTHEGFGDDFGQPPIHSETLARPVRRGAQTAHLPSNRATGIFLPLPHFFQEFLAAEVMARNALCVQLALDNDLRSNTGMVGARLPQGIGAAHAVVARQGIHDGLVEAMAHMQRASHVGWRQQDAEVVSFGRVEIGSKIALVLPEGVPAGLYVLGFK